MSGYATSRYATFDHFYSNLRELIDKVLQAVKIRFGTMNEFDLGQKVAIFYTPMLEPFAALIMLSCIFMGITLGTIQGANPPRSTTLAHLESTAMAAVLHPG